MAKILPPDIGAPRRGIDPDRQAVADQRFQAANIATSKIAEAFNASAILTDVNKTVESGVVVTGSHFQNSDNTAAIRLSGTEALPTTNYIDFTATGNNAFLKHTALTLEADGDATFAGAVSTSEIITVQRDIVVPTTIALFEGFGDYPLVHIARFNGTIASPTAVLSGETLGSLRWFGATGDGSGAHHGSDIRTVATENFSNTAAGSKLFVGRNRQRGNQCYYRRDDRPRYKRNFCERHYRSSRDAFGHSIC